MVTCATLTVARYASVPLSKAGERVTGHGGVPVADAQRGEGGRLDGFRGAEDEETGAGRGQLGVVGRG